MKNNFKHINSLIIILTVLTIAVGLAVFKIRLSQNTPPSPSANNNSVEIYHPQSVGEEKPSETIIPTDYTLELKNGILYFYLNSESDRVLLEASPINVTLFPTDDIKALSKSITVKTLEEGISIIEDFTS